MSIRCKPPITVLIVLLPLLALSMSFGATVEEGPSNLGLQCEVQKATFVRLEPVFVTCRLENPVTWDITAEIRSLTLEDRYLQLSVQEGDGDEQRYYFGPVVDTVGGSTRSFEPGDTMVETIRVFFNDVTRDLAFVHTGQHKIHGRVYLGNHPQPVYKRAQPVEIEVTDPQPEDLEIISTLGSEERLITLLRRGPRRYCQEEQVAAAECFDSLNALVTDHPDSAYAPAIAFLLAQSTRYDWPDLAPDATLESKLYQDFLNRWPDHPLAPSATKRLIYALDTIGEEERALEWLGRFERKYPDRESPRRALQQLHQRR